MLWWGWVLVVVGVAVGVVFGRGMRSLGRDVGRE